MALVICNDEISNVVHVHDGDIVCTDIGEWGIVGWGGRENGMCVYYLDGSGHDSLTDLYVKTVIASEMVTITLEIMNS